MRTPREWSQPVILPASQGLDAAVESTGAVQVYDTKEHLLPAMQEEGMLDAPEELDDHTNWVYFPWQESLVRYPEAGSHYKIRTSRNRPVIDNSEQARLHQKARIASLGLSVGSRILFQALQTGIGHAYLLADPDTIDPTNLNRIDATTSSLGEAKVSWAAKKVSEVDPYAEQTHLENGFTDDSSSMLEAFNPSVIVEEVDMIGVKAMIRLYAKEHRVPVIMIADLGEKTVVDVERYDTEDVRFFNGKLDESLVHELADGLTLSEEERIKVLIQLSGGIAQIPPRMIRAAGDLKRGEIRGIPQLGATAAQGAVYADAILKEIHLGRSVGSGTRTANPRKALRLKKPDSIRRVLSTYREFIQRKVEP